MSSFTALMALSASQTQEHNNIVQRAIQERDRKVQQLRKQQADREERQREMDNKLRLQHFENEKRERERKQKMEEAIKVREAALQRRKDEQRDALLYGPRKAVSTKAASSPSSGGAAGKERRKPQDDDGNDSSPTKTFTREELREKKQQMELKRLYGSTRRSAGSHSYTRPGRRLPGGAVDVMTTSRKSDALAGKSVKDRLAAMPNTLTKLNTVKRDTRTIDEIVTDLAKKKDGKVLDGDNAKNFDDWFSTKKKDSVKKIQASSLPDSGTNTPTSSAPAQPAASPKKMVASSTAAMAPKRSVMKAPISKISGHQGASKAANGSRMSSLDRPTKVSSTSASGKPSKLSSAVERERDRDRDRYPSSHPSSSSVYPSIKKRPRSDSDSDSSPPRKKAVSHEEDLPDDISSTIWRLFGRKRDRYMAMDVFSDDEDMEADACSLEQEEMFSTRIAKKEDLQALEEEKRHEEEKRKRKKEKERFGRAGQ